MIVNIPSEVLNAQAIFVNHSGGKDSQAMLAKLISLGLKDRLVVIHANLGEMEWEPMHNWIEKISFGLPVNVVNPPLDFFQLCRKFNRLPSGLARFCTSELKTAPINKWIKSYCKEKGLTNVVSCLGIRAQESPLRAKKIAITLSKSSTKSCVITEWLPILEYKLENVWQEISQSNQAPHEIYSKGFSRLSCVFCVFGKVEEHKKAKELKPDLFKKMASLERELGKTIRVKQVNKVKFPKYLDETFVS